MSAKCRKRHHMLHSISLSAAARDQRGFHDQLPWPLQVDDQLEARRLLDRNVHELCPAQHFDSLPRPLAEHVKETRTLANQAAAFRHLRPMEDGT